MVVRLCCAMVVDGVVGRNLTAAIVASAAQVGNGDGAHVLCKIWVFGEGG